MKKNFAYLTNYADLQVLFPPISLKVTAVKPKKSLFNFCIKPRVPYQKLNIIYS